MTFIWCNASIFRMTAHHVCAVCHCVLTWLLLPPSFLCRFGDSSFFFPRWKKVIALPLDPQRRLLCGGGSGFELYLLCCRSDVR